MKKRYLLSFLLLGAAFMACDDREMAVVSDDPAAPVLEAPATTTKVFTEAEAADTAYVFEWSAADYGYAAAASYSLSMDIKGAGFANAIELANVTTTSAAVTVSKINTALLTLGGSSGVAMDVVLRLTAKVTGAPVETVVSDSIELNLTPFEVVIVYPHLNLPGSFQPYGAGAWNGAGTDYSRIYSLKSDDRYEGYVYMVRDNDPANSVEFKFTKVNWGDGEYSYSEAGKLVSGGGGNIALTTGGYYKVSADLNSLTYTTLLITRWGVIGSATADGWNSDQAMTYDPATNKWNWTGDLSAGKIKFRANNGWDINYGDDGADLKLNAGGADIDVPEAGNYTVTLNLVGPVYTYKVKKN